MEEAARQFVRRVLLIHLLLLGAVAALVFFASREVYHRTQEQAMDQFKARQKLLASQTRRGIEAFYHSIRDDVDLLRSAPSDDEEEEASPTTEPATRPATRPHFRPRVDWKVLNPSGQTPAATAIRTFMGAILSQQLDRRVSHLFSVDRDKLLAKKPGDRPERPGSIQPLGHFDKPESELTPFRIVHQNLDWFKSIEKPQISPFELYDAGSTRVGLNLICIPTVERNPKLLVAAVPIRIAEKLLTNLNTDEDSTHAILADENGTIMIGNRALIVGRNLAELNDKRIARFAQEFQARHDPGTKHEPGIELLEDKFRIGGEEFPPSVIALDTVSVLGKKWTLMVITPTSDVDQVVGRIFSRAIYWAIFVICSVTAVLVSSSVQLIRSRIRAERRHTEVLTRELTQAREIQLAWLPREAIAIPSIDIAAINQPASHISGDFYNWFELPDGRTVVTIGDVTGHGMSAAFLMATTQLLVHNTMLRLEDPGQTLQEVNRQLCVQVFNGQFVTMVLCVIDVNAGTLEVATAGHYPPVLGQGGSFTELPVEPQLVLGVEKDTIYHTERFDLPAAASIVLYTDGVIDASSPQGKRFGLDRLIDSLKGHTSSAQDTLDSIVAHLTQFRGPSQLPDDLTLVCIQTQTESAYRAAENVALP